VTYPVDPEPESSNRQGPGPYPADYPAVRPEDVAPYNCDHDSGFCVCVHDWRINWGNIPKRNKSRATYVTDSP
jgi:hypothetical protein